MYQIQSFYDGSNKPRWGASYSDALQAFEEFAKFTDWGFANEYLTVNLTMPSGKMYTKIFYRDGRVVVK